MDQRPDGTSGNTYETGDPIRYAERDAELKRLAEEKAAREKQAARDSGDIPTQFAKGMSDTYGKFLPSAATMGGYTPNPEAFNLMQQGAAPLANAYDAQAVAARQAGAAGVTTGAQQQTAQQALGTGAQGTFAGMATGNQQQGAANAGAFNTTAAGLNQTGANAQARTGVNVNYGESANLSYQQAQDRARALGLVNAQTQFAAQGPGPSAAQAQLQQGSEANQLRTLSLARSGRGFGQNAAAMQQALGSAADTQAQTNQQAAILRAQEAANWRGQQLQAYGQAQQGMQGIGAQNLQGRALAGQESQYQAGLSDQQRARNDALMSQYASLGLNAQQFGASNQLAYNQLAGQNQAQGYQAQLGFNTLGQNAYGQGLQYNLGQGQLGQQYANMGLDAYKAQLAASMGYENLKSGNIMGTQQFNAQAQNANNNGIIGGAMGLIGGIFSDEQGKTNIQPLGGESGDDDIFARLDAEARRREEEQQRRAEEQRKEDAKPSAWTNAWKGAQQGYLAGVSSDEQGKKNIDMLSGQSDDPVQEQLRKSQEAYEAQQEEARKPKEKKGLLEGILSDKNSKKTIQMLSDELNSAQAENKWMAGQLGPEYLKNAPGTHDLVRKGREDKAWKESHEGHATSRINEGFVGPRYDVSIGEALIEPEPGPLSAYEQKQQAEYLDQGYDLRAATRLAQGDLAMERYTDASKANRGEGLAPAMAEKFRNYQAGAPPEGQVEGERPSGPDQGLPRDLTGGRTPSWGPRATVAPRGVNVRPPEWDPYDPEIGRFWGVSEQGDHWGPSVPGTDRERREHDTARYFPEEIVSDETKKKDKKEIDDGLDDIRSKYRSIMPSKGSFKDAPRQEETKPPSQDEAIRSAQARTMAPNPGFQDLTRDRDRQMGNLGQMEGLSREFGPTQRPTEVDMSRAPAYSYEYKNPGAPGAAPGRQVGPMAQDLGHIPGVVKETPQGKMVDGQRLTMANTAAIGQSQRENDELRRKLDELKAQYRSIMPSQGRFQ